MSAAGFLILVLIAAGSEEGADPGPKPVEVQFEGPTGCAGADGFFASLRSRTAHVRAAEGEEPRTTLQVRLTRERGRVVGELRTIDDSGASDTRKVQGASCQDVVQALSLTAALALDPTAILSVSPETSGAEGVASDRPAGPGTEKPPAPDSPRPAAPAVEKPAPALKEPPKEPAAAAVPVPPSRRPVPSWELGARLLGLSFLSAGFSPGATLDVHKNLGSGRVFRPSFGLAFVYARNDLFETPAAAAAALVAVAASGCPVRVSAGFLTIQPCAAFWGGLLSTAGRHLTQENRVDHLWLSAGLTLRAALWLGRGFSLQLEGGLQAPLFKRRYFATVPSNVRAETPALSPVVGVGLTYGLP